MKPPTDLVEALRQVDGVAAAKIIDDPQGVGTLQLALSDEADEISVAMATSCFGGPQPAALNPDRWIARAQMQHQRCLGGEAGLAGNHHMGLAEGLLQAQLRNATPKFCSGTHLQITTLLQGNQLRLASGGCIPAGCRHRRNDR